MVNSVKLYAFHGIDSLEKLGSLNHYYQSIDRYLIWNVNVALRNGNISYAFHKELGWLRKPLQKIVAGKYGDRFKEHYRETIKALQQFKGMSLEEAALQVQRVEYYYKARELGKASTVNKIENVYKAILKDYLRYRIYNIIKTVGDYGVNPLVVKAYIGSNKDKMEKLNNIVTDKDWDECFNFVSELENKVISLAGLDNKYWR